MSNNTTATTTPPQDFTCCITQDLMQDPVIAADGQSYERSAIEEWFYKGHSSSPMTGAPLSHKHLTPNCNLKSQIEAWKQQHKPQSTPQSTPQQQSTPPQPPQPATPVHFQAHLDAHTTPQQKHQTILHLRATTATLAAASTASTLPNRRPTDIILLVDRSGSMGSTADVPGAKTEQSGHSLLDIAKHAANTVSRGLGPEDCLGVYTFDSTTKVVAEFTYVTKAYQSQLTDRLTRVHPQGQTNMWDGIKRGLTTLSSAQDTDSTRHQVMIVLTDGQPNPEPPRGSLAMLQRAQEKHHEQHPDRPFPTIHTFGFGYDVNSKLLHNLANTTGGTYTFIPDAGMVGTGFVNRMATILSNAATEMQFKVSLPEGMTLSKESVANKSIPWTVHDWGISVSVGQLQHGQSKDLVVTLDHSSQSTSMTSEELAAELLGGMSLNYVADDGTPVQTTVDGNASTAFAPIDLVRQQARQALVDLLYHLVFTDTDRQARRTRIDQTIETVRQIAQSHLTDTVIQAYLKDIEGEVTTAIQLDDHYRRWGRHYLLSLMNAHSRQECNNFKDPGVQVYGGALFKKLQDEIDDVFNELPPPKPSNAMLTGRGATRGGGVIRGGCSVPAAPISMRNYNTCSNPCFTGDSRILLSDGITTKRIDRLTTRDVIRTADGSYARVQCVLETRTRGGASLVCLPSPVSGDPPLRVTPTHPVDRHYMDRMDRDSTAPRVYPTDIEWVHPRDLIHNLSGASPVYDYGCRAVYSVLAVRSDGAWASTMVVNRVACVTLAHGLMNDAVATHSFYGTDAVVDALRRCPGFEKGRVVLWSGDMVVRDKRGWAAGIEVGGSVMGASL